MDEIKYNVLLSTEENCRIACATLNTLIRELQTGRVWENKVQAERQTAGVYQSLPASVQAEMIQEEFDAALKEMEEELV